MKASTNKNNKTIWQQALDEKKQNNAISLRKKAELAMYLKGVVPKEYTKIIFDAIRGTPIKETAASAKKETTTFATIGGAYEP